MPPVKPIRVLFFSRVPKIGGGETSLLSILAGLDRSATEPVFAAVEPGPLALAVEAMGVKVEYIGPVPSGLLSIEAKSLLQKTVYSVQALPSLWRLYRLLRGQRIDIAHANEALEAAFLWLPCRLAGVPLIWTVRNLFSLRPLYKFLYHRSAAVMAVSKAAAEPLMQMERSGQRGKTRVIYEGIELPPLFEDPFRSRPYTAAIIGRLSPDKGQELFIRAAALAAAENRELRFLVAGDTHLGNPEYAGYLKDLAGSLDLKGKLEFTGFVPDVWKLMRSVDMAVMACPIEAFGRVTIEAMAAGRPVIGLRAGGTAEIILPGETGLLIDNDPRELSKAMLELAGHPQKSIAMGQAGRQRAGDLFSTGRMVGSIAEMYQDVLRK